MFDWLFGSITRTDDWYGREYETSRWEEIKSWIPFAIPVVLFAIVLVLVVLKETGVI